MNIKLKYIAPALLLLVLGVGKLNAQQLSNYSQYMLNKFLINPAIAGSEGYAAINLLGREQWIGISETPRHQSISFQTRMLKNSFIRRFIGIKTKGNNKKGGNVGLAAHFSNETRGALRHTTGEVTYAYHISTKSSQLSFGLSGTALQVNLRENVFKVVDQNDPYLNLLNSQKIIPDANFGAYFINQEFDAGISVQSLFQSALKLTEDFEEYQYYRNIFMHGGYRYSPRKNHLLEFTGVFQFSKRNMQIDFGSRLFYHKRYWTGLAYRKGLILTTQGEGYGGSYGDFIISGGFKLNDFIAGYSFDLTLNSIQKRSLGSHEFLIAYKIGENARRYRWLNRF